MIGGRVRGDFPRAPASTVEAIGGFPTGIVSDALNRMGAIDAAIRPLVAGRPFCGTALTVEEAEGGNLMSHAALGCLQPGDVIVIAAKGITTRASWGGIQTKVAIDRGARAVLVDGAVRDFDEIVSLGLPVYARGLSPGGPLKGWGGNVGYPIAFGGVAVSPGDVVIGDNDGVVVVPLELAADVPSHCEGRVELESGWRRRIEAGETTVDVLGLDGKLREFGVSFE